MNIKTLFIASARSLNKHKLRSILTTLGIIIGVTAIIAVMSIGEGAKYRVGKEIEKLGSNFIIALSKPPKQRMMIDKKMFKQSTFNIIVNEVDGLANASPASMQSVVAVYGNNNQRTMAVGVSVPYFTIREWPIEKGNFFTESDEKGAKKVVLLGQTANKELFGESVDPIGKTIRIKNVPFKVIGLLSPKGTNPGGQDEDDTIFMPLTTYQRKIVGTIDKFHAMIFAAKSKEVITKAAMQIGEILRQQHHIKPGDDEDFTIFTQDDISQATDATFAILNLLLFAVASIALIVGGIGIMNIMLVSVTERTKEIGIRLALGALQSHILNQFLFEAVIICLLGGLVGVSTGVGASILICKAFSWPIVISKVAVIISLLSSVFIGIFFGYYPAFKASKLNPVDALAER